MSDPLFAQTFPSPKGGDVTVEVIEGDEGRPTTTVRINGTEVIIYSSLIEDGRLVIDVDTTEAEPEDETGERIAIAVNDHYVHGGPAKTG